MHLGSGQKVWPSWLPQYCINILAKLFRQQRHWPFPYGPLPWHCWWVIRKRVMYVLSFSLHFFITVSLWMSHRCHWTNMARQSPTAIERQLLWDDWKQYGWVHIQLVHYTGKLHQCLMGSWYVVFQCSVGLKCVSYIHIFGFSLILVHYQCFNSDMVACVHTNMILWDGHQVVRSSCDVNFSQYCRCRTRRHSVSNQR